MAKKKRNSGVDVIPDHCLTMSDERYRYLIQKYGSGIINSGTNLIILS